MTNYVFLTGSATATWNPAVRITWYLDGPSGYLSEVSSAFAAWDAEIDLDFQMASSRDTANIVISFAAMDGPYNTLALGGGGGIYFGQSGIVFDTGENWTYDAATGHYALDGNSAITFYEVTVHEIGHVLNLGHPDNSNTVMYYSAGGTATALTFWDIYAARLLYGAESTTSALPTLDLAISGTPALVNASVMQGTEAVLNYTLAVAGTGTSGTVWTGVFASQDATFDYFNDRSAAWDYFSSVTGGTTLAESAFIDTANFLPGTYTLFGVADAAVGLYEANEANNISSAFSLTVIAGFDRPTAYFDRSGVLVFGGAYEINVDQGNSEWFDWYRNDVAANGQMISQRGASDDGNVWVNFYSSGALTQVSWSDYNNNETFSSRNDYFDSALRWTHQTGTYDNGVTWLHDLDETGTEWYAWYRNEMTPGGVLLSQHGMGDDGNLWQNLYTAGQLSTITWTDGGANEAYTSYTDHFDSAGRWTHQTGTLDSGATWLHDLDETNTLWFSWYRNEWAANGALTRQVGETDDGNSWQNGYSAGQLTSVTWTDGGANEAYTSYVDNFDTAGRWTHQTGTYDNGITWLHDLDEAGTQWYAWFRNEYSVGTGIILSQIGENDEGNIWQNSYSNGQLSHIVWTDRGANDPWTTFTDTPGNYGNGLTIYRTGTYDNGGTFSAYF